MYTHFCTPSKMIVFGTKVNHNLISLVYWSPLNIRLSKYLLDRCNCETSENVIMSDHLILILKYIFLIFRDDKSPFDIWVAFWLLDYGLGCWDQSWSTPEHHGMFGVSGQNQAGFWWAWCKAVRTASAVVWEKFPNNPVFFFWVLP